MKIELKKWFKENKDLLIYLVWHLIPKRQPKGWITKNQTLTVMKYMRVPKSKVSYRDNKNKAFTASEMRTALNNMPKIPMTYRKDLEDCDKFADIFSSMIQLKYPGVYQREIRFNQKNGGHAINLIITSNLGVWFIEPQNIGTRRQSIYSFLEYKQKFKVKDILGVW